jgi:anti-sigma factor RsiW
MTHDRIRRLVPLLADGELGPLRRALVARHVARCPTCSGALEAQQSMRNVIRERLPMHRAPPDLAARIGAALPREAPPPLSRRPWFRRPALGFAGTGLAGALAGVALTLLVAGGPGANQTTVAGGPGANHGTFAGGFGVNRAIMDAVIDSHVRSMEADHLTDVATSDRHTVKPWLSARVDVSPPVKELAAEGFPLIGGRLDYVAGHRAAAIVYRHDKHIINLITWAAPGQPDEGFRQMTAQGFNVVTWRSDGIRYYAVSDLEPDQLATFARLVAGG